MPHRDPRQERHAAPPDNPPKLYLKTLFVDRGGHPAYENCIGKTCAAAAGGWLDLRIGCIGWGDNSLRQLNRSVADFLTTPQDIFWIQGNDTDWEVPYIRHMAAQCTPEAPVIGGLFSIKSPELRWCYDQLPGAAMDPRTGLMEVSKVGLESIMIHREVFTRWMRERPEDMYHSQFPDFATPEEPEKRNTEEWNFWKWEIHVDQDGKRRLMSEDYNFCHTAKQLGFPIYADHSHYCGHWDNRTRFPFKEPMVKNEQQPTGTVKEAAA